MKKNMKKIQEAHAKITMAFKAKRAVIVGIRRYTEEKNEKFHN